MVLPVGEHLPLRSDSILLHPETMRTCGCVIASPVVVRGRGEDGAYVCGKAWPSPSLPLDGMYMEGHVPSLILILEFLCSSCWFGVGCSARVSYM